MKENIKNFLLMLVSIALGLIIFYFAAISNLVLEKYDIPGKLTKVEAEKKVEEAGFYPLYSWYQVVDFMPYVIVMSESEDGSVADKVYVKAFSGEIDEYGKLKK